MWMIPPEYLCRKHLLGEHVELHMLVGCINKGHSIQGYIDKGLCDVSKISARHRDLAVEIEKRGYKHSSPLKYFVWEGETGSVDVNTSLLDLTLRCPECLSRMTVNRREEAERRSNARHHNV